MPWAGISCPTCTVTSRIRRLTNTSGSFCARSGSDVDAMWVLHEVLLWDRRDFLSAGLSFGVSGEPGEGSHLEPGARTRRKEERGRGHREGGTGPGRGRPAPCPKCVPPPAYRIGF